MSMQVRVDGHTFMVSYQELRESYLNFVGMNDEEFSQKLPQAAHLACVICWFKEVGAEASIGDRGIVHELLHLMALPPEDQEPGLLGRVREQFETLLKLD